MAYINITLEELARLAKSNLNSENNRIKDVGITDGNAIVLTVGIGDFFPDIKVLLTYNRFERGDMYFNVASGGAVKMVMGLLNELNSSKEDNFIKLKGQNVVIELNKMIQSGLKGMTVIDVNVTGNQAYITIKV